MKEIPLEMIHRYEGQSVIIIALSETIRGIYTCVGAQIATSYSIGPGICKRINFKGDDGNGKYIWVENIEKIFATS